MCCQSEFQMVIRSTLELPRLAEAESEMLEFFKRGVLPSCPGGMPQSRAEGLWPYLQPQISSQNLSRGSTF